MDRLYTTISDLFTDISREGLRDESSAMRAIRAASKWIDEKLGSWIPTTAAKRFDGDGSRDLYVPPLLAVSSIVDDADPLLSTDYLLYPRNKCWENGPYQRITLDPDATTISNWTAEDDIVVVTGRWGMYEANETTGATVASQTDSATSLVASAGQNISPGAVLLIETEQELVDATGAATDSTTNTNEALDNSEEEIDVVSGAAFNVGEIIKVEFEQMKILDIATNTISVLRGWNQTKKVAHLTNLDIYVYRTFTVKRGVNGTTAAAHTSKTIYRYRAPEDVEALCRELAALKLALAGTNYTGRAGNAELGEGFYIDELPTKTIDKIKNNYRIWSL